LKIILRSRVISLPFPFFNIDGEAISHAVVVGTQVEADAATEGHGELVGPIA